MNTNQTKTIQEILFEAEEIALEVVKALKGDGFEDNIHPQHSSAKTILWKIRDALETLDK